jgi:cytosine deaminase
VTVVIDNCRLLDHPDPVEVAIADGRVAGVGSGLVGEERWDAGGHLLLPGLVEAHTHLDKCFTMRLAPNRSGTLAEAIERWHGLRGGLRAEDYQRRAEAGVRRAMAAGVTLMRSHVDVGGDVGLRALEALVAVRERYRSLITIELVAMGPVEGEEGWEGEALRAGADLLGGAPWLASDPAAAIERVLVAAGEAGVRVDVHIDETDDPRVVTLGTLAERVLALGLEGRVTASHCCSLSALPPEAARPVIERVAEARIGVVSLPSCNLVLQGRRATGPWPRGVTRVKDLLAAGVPVAFGSDNVQDVFNPFGNFDPLLAATIGAHACHLTGEEELELSLELVSSRAAAVLGRDAWGVCAGAPADLVLLDAETPAEAVAAPVARLAQWRNGFPLGAQATDLT